MLADDAPVQRPPRLSAQVLLNDFADDVLSLDRGLAWTVWQLLVRPGWAIRRYLEWRDARFVRPFRLAVGTLALAALAAWTVGVGDDVARGFVSGVGNVGASIRLDAALRYVDWFLLLCWAPAVGGALQRCYPGCGLNVAEAFVFGLYTLAPVLLVFAGVALLEPFAPGIDYLLILAAPWMLFHAIAGFTAPNGYGRVRAVACTLVASLYLVAVLGLALVAIVFVILSVQHMGS
jgi:hypothetical protein